MQFKNKIVTRLVGFTMSVVMMSSYFGAAVFAEEGGLALTVDAKSAVIMEASSGKILFEQNGDERRSPASVTKIMTILLIYEALEQGKIKWDDIVTVSEHAAGMGGSQVYLEVMEKQTVRDLTKSIVIASANDAAVTMAEYISGSEESFVDLMNKKAKSLGMENTNFKNACGLDIEGHYTSAKDIALMSRELITKYPGVKEFTTTWMDSITHKTARGEEEFGLTNTNKLVKWYSGATGLKTGSTSEALFCLSGTAERNGMELIAVIMAAPTPTQRFQEVMKMLDYGFANYKIVKGQEPGTVVGSVKVNKGDMEEVAVMVDKMISNVTPKGSNSELEAEILIDEGINAPVIAGAKAGEIIYKYEGKEIGRANLVVEEDVAKASLGDIMNKLFHLWFQ